MYSALQSHNAVTVHLTGEQLLPYGFARQYSSAYTCHNIALLKTSCMVLVKVADDIVGSRIYQTYSINNNSEVVGIFAYLHRLYHWLGERWFSEMGLDPNTYII